MLIKSTSAIASAKSEVVCSKVCKMLGRSAYHALLATFLAVSALDVKHENVFFVVVSHPDSFGCLCAAVLLIHDFELRVEEQVKQSAFKS
jgi:hypothetical protein